MAEFSDYVIYADESGDHSLVAIDSTYPIFVLCLCVFNKRHYSQYITPAIQRLKFKWFGHDAIILHERDIRQKAPPFEFLNNPTANREFLSDLTSILRRSRITLIPAVIDKRRLKFEYLFQDNPYHIALGFCVELTQEFLLARSQENRIVHFLFETRGKKEDRDLEFEFRRVIDGQNKFGVKLANFEIRFIDKKANAAGMQLADLTARPIGLQVLRPHQPNRAFDVIAPKLIKNRSGGRRRELVKVFP